MGNGVSILPGVVDKIETLVEACNPILKTTTAKLNPYNRIAISRLDLYQEKNL
jgi:hypothetical protein